MRSSRTISINKIRLSFPTRSFIFILQKLQLQLILSIISSNLFLSFLSCILESFNIITIILLLS